MNTIEDNKPKTMQLRRTAVDVEKAQAQLYQLIIHHVNTRALLNNQERQGFIKLVDDAVLSYGHIQGTLKPRSGAPIFPITLTGLAYLLMESKKSPTTLTDGYRRIQMRIEDMWLAFLSICKVAFIHARAEALHMSAEVDASYGKPTSFQFSQDTFDTGVDK